MIPMRVRALQRRLSQSFERGVNKSCAAESSASSSDLHGEVDSNEWVCLSEMTKAKQ